MLFVSVCVLCVCFAGSTSGPPPGAVPTFSVTGLTQLTQVLRSTAPTADNLQTLAASAAGAAASVASSSSNSSFDATSSIDGLDAEQISLLGWSLRSQDSLSSTDDDDDEGAAMNAAEGLIGALDPSSPGAPAPGLDFFDFLVEQGAIKTASTSFPRMGE